MAVRAIDSLEKAYSRCLQSARGLQLGAGSGEPEAAERVGGRGAAWLVRGLDLPCRRRAERSGRVPGRLPGEWLHGLTLLDRWEETHQGPQYPRMNTMLEK